MVQVADTCFYKVSLITKISALNCLIWLQDVLMLIKPFGTWLNSMVDPGKNWKGGGGSGRFGVPCPLFADPKYSTWWENNNCSVHFMET